MDYFHLETPKDHLHGMSNLALAYLGDSVYEVMVRSWLCQQGKLSAGKLNQKALAYVTAPAQARRAERILPQLSQTEQDVYRRGRNTKPRSIPKGATRGDYQSATGLETLFGWLYLQGETARLSSLFTQMMTEAPHEGPAPGDQ